VSLTHRYAELHTEYHSTWVSNQRWQVSVCEGTAALHHLLHLGFVHHCSATSDQPTPANSSSRGIEQRSCLLACRACILFRCCTCSQVPW
jgi:hypothetical protein